MKISEEVKEAVKQEREENKKRRSLFEQVTKTTYKNGFELFQTDYVWMERSVYEKEMKKYQEPIASEDESIESINVTYERVPIDNPHRLYYYLHWLSSKVNELREKSPSGYEDHFEILIKMFANRNLKGEIKKGDA